MWSLNYEHAVQSGFSRYEKKHQREYDACFVNLHKVMTILNGGNKFGSFNVGFLRSEHGGVYRIGESGVPGAKATRLYIYPDAGHEVIYVLKIGSKDGQSEDINEAKEIVE